MAQNHITQPSTYWMIFAALIILTVTTIGIDILERNDQISLGAWHNTISLTIATVKALMVILFFMHVWYSPPLTWIVALGSLLWLGILISYTLTDYMSRTWLFVPGY